jgi:hypothetical protein
MEGPTRPQVIRGQGLDGRVDGWAAVAAVARGVALLLIERPMQWHIAFYR